MPSEDEEARGIVLAVLNIHGKDVSTRELRSNGTADRGGGACVVVAGELRGAARGAAVDGLDAAQVSAQEARALSKSLRVAVDTLDVSERVQQFCPSRVRPRLWFSLSGRVLA